MIEQYLVELYFPYVLAFFLAMVIVYFTIPPIIRVAKLKKLYDEPDGDRKLNTHVVPTLGGLAIFLGFVIAVVLSSYKMEFIELRYIVAALVIILFVGLKDDILYISPKSKLIGQLVTAAILVIFANVRFTSLHGLLGIYEINYWVSLPLSIFGITVLTNSLNLIDGIDGLCSGVGFLSAFLFGILFYLNDDIEMTIVAAALSGSLFSFFIYNVFGKKNKIFMGDTGSLIIGFLLATLAVKFNEIHLPDNRIFQIKEPPSISVAILIVPIMDTLRVFTLRILDGRSPFSADNLHTHHQLIRLGLTHFQASIVYIIYNFIFFAIAMFLQHYLDNFILLFTLFTISLAFLYIPTYLSKKVSKETKKNGLKNNGFNRTFRKLADRSNT
jgi:UDP-N-acetylmuramyl pentapeptide phosphotransferase/UDP-N-acetylglucosamine-1-phosphate transferase